jgi:hypothetical protein
MENVKEKDAKALKIPETKKPVIDPRPTIDPVLLEEVGHFLEDAEGWFRTPNTTFEGRAPIELLGTPEEARIRERIDAANLGLYT